MGGAFLVSIKIKTIASREQKINVRVVPASWQVYIEKNYLDFSIAFSITAENCSTVAMSPLSSFLLFKK